LPTAPLVKLSVASVLANPLTGIISSVIGEKTADVRLRRLSVYPNIQIELIRD